MPLAGGIHTFTSTWKSTGFFKTGDLGHFDKAGYLHIVGRDKDLVISGGFNVYPREIEQIINEFSGIAESAVVGITHPDLGEGVTAIIVAQPGVTLEEKAIREHLASQLSHYKLPRRILFTELLLRNVMGKVQKNLLRDAYSDIYKKTGA